MPGPSRIRELEVPIIVDLARQTMSLREVLNFLPGAIIELSRGADEPLELRVNNETIALGAAVKVGENFGIRVTEVGTDRQRAESAAGAASAESGADDDMAAMLAEQLLAGQ